MELQFLLAGLLTGILVSLGVGPVTLLVAHRTLHKGWIFGITTGLGIAFADIIYAILSRTGLVFLNEFITGYKTLFELIVSIIFIIVGIYIFFSHNHNKKSFYVKKSYFKNFLTGFFLNIVNIVNILLFAIIFSKLIPLEVHTVLAEVLLILGITIGACMWRISLSYILSHFQVKIEKIYILNKILGILIFLGGIFTLVQMYL